MPTSLFHPITAAWFLDRFGAPTEAQRLGWPEIAAGRHTLIAAPTGSGKTLAAFLAAVDSLLRQASAGELADEIQVLYISPLKALSNDIARNLEVPLAELGQHAIDHGAVMPRIRAMVRTGDTTSAERQKMLRKPPHILVTTPESLYLLLTAEKGRERLRTVRTVIVDEIHALARDKRGSHLALSLERLEAICPAPPVRIGLSATQKPVDRVAAFLVGSKRIDATGKPKCSVVDIGHARSLDLAIEVPETDLSAVCSHETWAEVYERLATLIEQHRSTLVFVNTRRMAERVSHRLVERLGEDAVASHHGSLSKELRHSAEERLKSGRLKAIVATASLELGIDIGFIDLVCQIGTPRAIATFLQRVGRSGHSLGLVPKGRLLALTRDELLECMALIRAVRGGHLDEVEVPIAPLDILAQQIVASVASEEVSETDLFETFRGAWPYRDLSRDDFDRIVTMLSEGIAPGRRTGAYLHRDAINGRLKARRGARIAAVTSGGAIPETALFRVVLAEDRTLVGTVDEDFAIESLAGDVFLLGTNSWRIEYVRNSEVVVHDAQGAAPNIPFWFGEAPGRTIELSTEISELRAEIQHRLTAPDSSAPRTSLSGDTDAVSPSNGAAPTNGSTQPRFDSAKLNAVAAWAREAFATDESGARQAVEYIAAQVAAIGLVPTQKRIVFERFFDESGGMQLVIHAPFGARINRAWGLALRKRFCRSFDFELQASADDNGIVLSLSPQHSFPIDRLFRMLRPDNGRPLLEQALLAAPMFQVRWRWNLTRSLAVLRRQGGKRIPPNMQRFRSDDLLAAVFPEQIGCLENHSGDLEIPDHPLVHQTVFDCLHEAMDVDRWLDILRDFEAGRIEFLARDTREPSPFSHELLNANPYAFLDPAPLEERRARAVATRRTLSVDDASDLGRLDVEAIALVSAEAWPTVRDPDELHDALLLLVALPECEGEPWSDWFEQLIRVHRATRVVRPAAPTLWCAAERWPLVRAALADATASPPILLSTALDAEHTTAEGTLALVRGRIESRGPVTAEAIAHDLGLRPGAVEAALEALEGEGVVLRGRFTPDLAPQATEWCERRLLARIHRLTIQGARRRVRAVEPTVYLRFLAEHQRLTKGQQLETRSGTATVLGQLQGFELPAGAWEHDVLPARLNEYDPAWLDDLCLSGEFAWGRLQPPRKQEDERPSGSSLTRVVPISIVRRADLSWLLPVAPGSAEAFARGDAQLVFETLSEHGALFLQDLIALTGLLPSQLDEALAELAALGLVTADGFDPIRGLIAPSRKHPTRRRSRRRSTTSAAANRGGRWSRFPGPFAAQPAGDRVERWARQLLLRWGVMFRDLLARESVAPTWQELRPVYRRLEARGEILGGRFITGVAGEQFATSEAVDRLRKLADADPDGRRLILSAADPLNLAGILTPGPRIPALRSNAIALRDGLFIASRQAGDIQLHADLDPTLAESLRRSLAQTGLVRQREEALTPNRDG